jgi:hypothetical protein
MGDSEKEISPAQAEDGSLKDMQNGTVDKSTVEYERAQLLANLPDPDEGKTEEERKAIVSMPTPKYGR